MSQPSPTETAPTSAKPFFRTDAGRFAAIGALLLGLAGIFLWRDLQLSGEYVPAFFAVLFTVAAVVKKPLVEVGSLGLLATALVAVAWFGVGFDPRLLWGLGLCTVGAVVNVAANHRAASGLGRTRWASMNWYLLAVSTLATSWAFYFRFFTIGIAEASLERRVVLTLAWLAMGVVMIIVGKMRSIEPVRRSGYLFLVVAVAKAMAYDTTHLEGSLRILVLGAAGVMVMGGGWLLSRSAPEEL